MGPHSQEDLEVRSFPIVGWEDGLLASDSTLICGDWALVHWDRGHVGGFPSLDVRIAEMREDSVDYEPQYMSTM